MFAYRVNSKEISVSRNNTRNYSSIKISLKVVSYACCSNMNAVWANFSGKILMYLLTQFISQNILPVANEYALFSENNHFNEIGW